ncbi:dTDP-4-dehydrorhamnose 3,5-epimerase family protein [Hyphomicrobium sp. MC1]|uniref:dTDP-4-dehydrorhamnose 3,5-epimerase family protein n=1 Tax=Hyphomicrobium sp. (strain MC1) TaxID=717785 RepID=UPI000213D5C1
MLSSRAGIQEPFVQGNFSLSSQAGTIHGPHFRSIPDAQAKLVCVSRGRIFDAAGRFTTAIFDIWQHVTAEFSARKVLQLCIPRGFAQVFCTLEPNRPSRPLS